MRRQIFFSLLLYSVFEALSASTPTATAMESLSPSKIKTDTIQLQELNVIAIKQGGVLSNQAVSSTSFNLAEIQLNNISDIKSISDIVPNFYMPNYGSRITSTIYVRGIGARMDQPVVGLNIDNLPVLNKDAYDLDLPDISEIEMLRGPQSILYGRNNMAGFINIRTISPMDWQGLRLFGELPGMNNFRFQGGWYHKFNDHTGFSAAFGLNSLQGRFKNRYNGKNIGSEQSGNLRIKFEWSPTKIISLLNTFSTNLMRQGGYPYEYVKTGEINYNDTCFYNRFLLNDALTLNFNFSQWSLSSITSMQFLKDNMTLDQDFLPLRYFTLTQKKSEVAVTEELLAQRTGRHKYKWIAGLFAFYRHLDMNAPVGFGDAGINQLIESHRNEANPFYPIKWDNRNFTINSNFTLPSFSIAIYHESRFTLGRWNINAGLRLDYEKVMMNYNSFTNTSYTIYNNPSSSLDTPFVEMEPYRKVLLDLEYKGDLSTDFLTLLPKVSVLYNLNGDLGNLYATFGKGYKAGGFNTQMFSDVLQQKLMSYMGLGSQYDVDDIVKYKPEYSYNYEIGGHFDFSSLSNDALSNLGLDVSLFYIDCRDQQLTMFPDGNTTGRIMTNAGKTRSFGGELSVSWNPYDPLVFNINYGYTNARFLKFHDGKEDYAGKQLPYAPSNTFFIQGLYTFKHHRLGKKSFILDINLRGAGKIYWNEGNTLSQGLYALMGASLTFKAPKWEIQAWGRNLTNTKYSVFYFMSMGNEFLQRGDKLTYGVSLRLII